MRIQNKLQARGYWAESLSDDGMGSDVGGGANAGGNAIDQIANLLGEESIKETPKKELKEESEEDDTQPDDSTQEGDDDGEEETEQSEDDDSDDVTWGKTLGIDDKNVVLDEEGNFVGVNVKVDGKVSTVDMKTLVDGYNYNKSNTHKAQQLSEQRKEFEELKTAVATEYVQKIEVVDKLTSHLKNALIGEYKNVDWNKLRAENPGEYAAAVQDFNARNAEIEQIINAVGAEKAGLTQEQMAEQQGKMQEHIKAQAEKVLENNPSWADPKVFKKTLTEMTDFVNESYGFTPEEFASVQDARLLELVKDAMKYRSSIKGAKTKLESKVPKFQKSVGSKPSESKLAKLTKKAKTTQGYHKRAAETDAITALLLGGN